MNLSDLLLIGFLLLLFWGARKLPDFARQVGESMMLRPVYNRAPEDLFFRIALLLLMVAALLWADILAKYL